MSLNQVSFIPVQGSEQNIQNYDHQTGHLYFATDTGRMYLDTIDNRINVGGGAGAAIFYGSVSEPPKDETSGYYTIESKDVTGGVPKLGDLILNSDGGFYKIEAIASNKYICQLLSISGSGGGGGSIVGPAQTSPSIDISIENTTLINGQEAYFTVKSQSAKKADGVTLVDTVLYVTYSLGTRITTNVINNYINEKTVKCNVDSNGCIEAKIEFGTSLKESATTVLSVYVWGVNHDAPSPTRYIEPITTSALKLNQLQSYTPANRYSANGFTISCNVIGSIDKIIKFYYDGVLKETRSIGYKSANSNPGFDIPAGQYDENNQPIPGTATHGCHKVKIELCQDLGGGVEGLYTEPLEYEIAVVKNDSSAPPVIWLGDYKSVYYTYDDIQIPFLVYDPANTNTTTVHLYKNKIEQEGSPREIKDFTDFTYWEITDASADQQNTYQISCGETEDRYVEREIIFTIEVDPNRSDYKIETGDLKLNFNATGRSNSESKAKRANWSYTLNDEVKSAAFTDFNWYNNGWQMDKEINQTRLIISNGAQLSIPYREMIFASNDLNNQSHTVEMQFRIRNIQNYDNLIKNITRYKFGEEEGAPDDSVYYAEFTAQKETGYSNYDAFLQWRLSAEDYEKLTFWKVEKIIQVENVVAGLYDYNPTNNSVVGFCVGTQDAFFSNGADTVNVNFVENELINLSFVYQHSLKQLYIYINGCITGVIKSSIDDIFAINSSNFIFKSDNCDIDLYKLRIYEIDLDVNQIVKNFAVDRKDIVTFDQNALAEMNNTLKEPQISYANMLKYNEEHPNAPLMPYIIFDTGAIDSKLPYSKEVEAKISVEFVNVPLDQAYQNGELEKLAREDGLLAVNENNGTVIAEAVKTYYKHHCPSFTSSIRTTDKVNFEVQGTSSEFYPRRNFKVKTKVSGNFNWEYDDSLEDGGKYTEDESLNMFMHKGPYAETYLMDQNKLANNPKYLGLEESRLADGWYMNNYTNATDRWTFKVDYMESSGSYNAGFASMVGNSYTKHPLKDYLNVLGGTAALKPVEPKALADDDGMRWQDYRTSLLGFPVMAFWKRGTGDEAIYTFIGYYRMLLDKSSTAVLGFKTPSKVVHKLFPDGLDSEGKQKYKKLRDVAECWEFSNNARGYCSYRDPWNRVELSFKPPVGVENEYTSVGAPIVADSFEYRYHPKDDYIDVLYEFDKAEQAALNEVAEELGLPKNAIIKDNRATGADALLKTHTNWEKVCKWLWSTNVDAVDSQGTYKEIPVGSVEYVNDGTFYIIDENNDFAPALGEFDATKNYYIPNTGEDKEKNPYLSIKPAPAEYVFESGKFYLKVAGENTEDTSDDIYAISYDAFDNSAKYYEFIEGDKTTYDTRFDLLVRPVNPDTEAFDASGETKYYTWHGTDYNAYDASKCVVVKKGSATGAVRKVTNPTADNWKTYYVENPVTYAGITYTHDTKEYRIAKFTNEFSRHFDPEYVATYFVMTEVLECYDSRGKNCMMASWGPKEQWLTDSRGKEILDSNGNRIPGEYIWYPIFYDIDTQLGINNTGIPSFEYNVDATEAGNYSTSDSILWNNFYKFFKNTWMLPKYQNLRNFKNDKFENLYDLDGSTSKAPLQSVDYIEKWYTFNPDTYHNIACRGVKPLIATNLDLYFKYITITNKEAINQGVAKLDRAGKYAIDPGTYFYALQGDRSQSRRQFLTNRLEYIDSWLTQGNYARAGTNCLWGRISANNRTDLNASLDDVHSDKWTDTSSDPYWKNNIEFGEKTHEFDAEYWLELKPIRSAYVTAGDDARNYPSEKYDGIHDMKFKLSALENGIRTSNNYPEQLLYIYGINQMSDLGDLSKMYWTEFKIEGEANRLTRLKLGHDGTTFDFKTGSDTEKTNIEWYNNKINSITWENTLPLLKEANFSNITITGSVKSMDLSGSEKLENFRATGSNLTTIKFADGVALNTLYYPSTVSSLSLVQANLLTDLILPPASGENPAALPEGQKYYKVPTNQLGAQKGLYLEGFFDDKATCSLNNIKLDGGNLGYNSYTILKRLWDKTNGKGTARVTMTGVDWCPYTQLTEGAVYDSTKDYYKDNGHYGFVKYNGPTQVLAGQTYDAKKTYYKLIDDKFVTYSEGSTGFEAAVAAGLYVEYVYNKTQFDADILSGILYIDNGHGGRVINEETNEVSFGPLVTALNDATINVLETLYVNRENFLDTSGQKAAELSGYIYIHNEQEVDESRIVELQSYYPNVTFFFAKVNKAYSARFVYFNQEDYSEKYVKWINGSTSPSVQKIQTYSDKVYFTNPFDTTLGYKPEKTHYDFVGWSLNNRFPYDQQGNIIDDLIITAEEAETSWSSQKLIEGVYDYTYYAIFKLHEYEVRFYNNNDDNYGEYVDEITGQKYHLAKIQYGLFLNDSGLVMPQAQDITSLEERNTFKGWSLNKVAGRVYESSESLKDVVINLSKYLVTNDYKLYAVFQNESVYDSITSHDYFIYTYNQGYPVINLNPEKGNELSGKITLPAHDPQGALIQGIGKMTNYIAEGEISDPKGFTGQNITHIFFEKNGQYKYVEEYAFHNPSKFNANSYKLYGVYLPDTIVELKKKAFQYARLEEITLSDNITIIGESCFDGYMNGGYANVKIMNLPSKLTTIGKYSFRGNTGIQFTSIPNGVTVIEDLAFKWSSARVTQFGGNNSKLTTIGKEAFKEAGVGREAIENIYLSSTVKTLGNDCFKAYGSLSGPQTVYTPLKEADVEWTATSIGVNTISFEYEDV